MNRAWLVVGAGILLGGAVYWAFQPAPEAAEPSARLDASGAVPVLRLTGPPRAKGEAYGAAQKDAIRAQLEAHRPADPGLEAFAIETCGQRILPTLPEDLRAEIEGIAAGAGVSVPEALFLNTRFELAALGVVQPRGGSFAGDAAAGTGPEVVRRFAPADLDPDDLIVVVHADRDPPLVLVALPGMAGGFLGLCGETAAALRPMQDRTDPALTGLPWPLLARVLLEHPPEPGARLPALPTVPASVAMTVPGGEAGCLNLGLAGAAWYPAGGPFAAATEERPPDGDRIGRVERPADGRALHQERARRMLAGDGGAGSAVRLKAGRAGFRVVIGDRGATVRYAD